MFVHYKRFGTLAFTFFFLFLFNLIGCSQSSYPKDNRGSLARARNGKLRVGVAENSPWVKTALNGKSMPGGIEPFLISRFADHLKSEVVWVPGAQSELLAVLEHAGLEVVIGGFEAQSPYSSEVIFTQPYFSSQLVVGHFYDVPDAKKGIKGKKVAVKTESLMQALLKEGGAEVIPLRFPLAPDQMVAGYRYELEKWGVPFVSEVMKKEERVLAVAPGENAFLLELERFLKSQDNEIQMFIRADAGGSLASH